MYACSMYAYVYVRVCNSVHVIKCSCMCMGAYAFVYACVQGRILCVRTSIVRAYLVCTYEHSKGVSCVYVQVY